MIEALGDSEVLHITDDRRGTYKSLACPYTGSVASVTDPVLLIERTRPELDDYLVLISVDGVDAFEQDLRAISSGNTAEQLRVEQFEEIAPHGDDCLACSGSLEAGDRIVKLCPVIHDSVKRSQEHTVLCHEDCADDLAATAARFWSHLGKFLD